MENKNSSKIVRFVVNDWIPVNSGPLSNFIDSLRNEVERNIPVGITGVNYIWELCGYAIFYYVTTTEEFIAKNELEEIYKGSYIPNTSSPSYNEEDWPEYDLSKLDKEDGNGMYREL